MTRILIRDLQPSSRYMLQLRAVGTDGSTSQWSRTFTLDTIADAEPPSPVTGLTVQSTGDSFVAQWTKPTTSSGGGPLLDFKHFAVTVSSSLFPGTTRTLITSSDEFSLTFEHNVSIFGAPAGTVTISVAAVDTTGNASSSVSATASNPPPSPVTGLTAESVTDGIGLTWDANNTDIDLKHYEVWLSTTGASGTYTKVMETSATSVIHTTNMYTTDHWYRVYSVDKFNTPSSPTQTTSAVRPKSPFAVDTTAPGMPTSLSASIVTNYPRADLLVSWTNPANPDNDLSHVTVAYRPVGETNWSFTNVDYTDTSVRIEGVQLYKNYEVKVAASDWSSNRSAYTAVVTTSTAATNTAPATVSGVAISAGADSVNVSWNANSEPDVANGAGTYLVNIATNSGFTTGLLQYRTGATSIAVTGLAQGQIYYARVKAVDSAGLESASWSSTVNATTGTISTFKYTTSPTAPSVKNEGDIWFDESTGFEKQWKSGAWVNTGNASIQYVTGQTNTLVKNYVTEYAVNSSESTPPSSGWSTSTPTRTPGTFIWYRVQVTYGDSTTSTTSPALLTGNTGATGSPGTPAAYITLTANTQVLASPSGGGATSPATATVTGTATNTTITVWQYSVNGGTFSNTVPAGVSRTGNVVTITGSTMTARTIAVRMADANGVADTLTVAKTFDGATGGAGSPGAPGADAYTVLLTNESHTFPGSTTAALAGSTTTNVLAFKGTTQQAATVGTITGQVAGLTTAITNNGTNNATVTVTVTTALTTQSGVLVIPVTVDGVTFSKRFSWSVAYAGAQGSQGIPGNPGADGTTYYTWLKYADTPTTGMSDSPTNKTYIGIAVNKTSPTESSNYADYTWSLIKGADGAAGKGISNTVVNYAKSTDGVNAPGSGWGTSIPSTSAGEFLWTRTVTTYTDASSSTAYSVAAHGTTGSPGAPGVGISGTEVRYQVHSNGTTAPTGTWLSSVPATSAGQFLWTRTVTSYTSGSPTTAYSVAAHGATGQQGIPGNPGADGTTTYTWVKYADNSSGGGMSDDPTGKSYIGLAFNKTTQTESTTAGDYQWSLIQGPQGTPGAPAASISLTATSQVLTSPSTGGATTPATTTVTGTPLNTTITVWQYSVNGGTFSNTVPAGASRTGNVVTITGSTMTARTIAVRMADANGVADTLTVAKVSDGATGGAGTPGTPGADAYTVLLTNESHAFPGSTSTALAGNTATQVLAFKGTTQMAATIGTVTGQVTGLTTAITNNGTTSATVTVTVTTSLVTQSGVLTIPVTVDGVTFSKRFSWSVAYAGPQGSAGSPGSPGTPGVSVTSVTPYFRTVTPSGASAPAKPTANPPGSPWTTTEPDYVANTDLYRTELVVFSNSTHSYTDVTKVSSYTAATTAIAAANGKNKIVHSTGTPGTTANTAGDTWVQYNGSNQIIAQWRGNGGTSWTQESISSQFIANLDAGKLTANSAFINTLNIGSGGAIQSAGYTSGGSSGFHLSNTGLVIKGTGNSVAVESIAAGTISAKTINIGATGTLNIDSTGQVKSNNYSSGSTGYRLSSSGLEVNDGVIDAKTLKTGSAFVTELTIGQSANNNGSLKSFGYSAGTTGWKLDKSGLEINNGDIAASALRLNSSPNLVPVQYADFEWDTFWYKSAFWSSGKGKNGIAESAIINGIVADPNTGKQSLGFSAFSSTAGWFALGLSNTDYNIALNDSGRYIFSFYAKNIASAADTWNVQIKGNNGNIIASQVIVLPANMTTFQRYSFAFDRPASGVVACVPIFNRTSTTHVTLVRFDSVQMELRTGNTDEPSIWKPPGTTMINGYGISTGEIRSTAYVSVNGTEYPSWSMNVNGNMQVGDALIRGKLLVGLAGDPDAGNSYIASGNYAANTSGWKIDSAGNAELNNGLFRGTITASYITGTTQITSGEIIAGNVLSRYSRVTGEGFQVLTIGAEGEANLELSLGSSDHSDMLILKRADGTISVSADNEGRLSAGTVSSDEDVMVGGIPLLGTNLTFEPDVGVGALYTGHIDKLPRGVIASAKFKGGGPWANGNMYINELTFDAHPGRHYRVVFSGAMGYARPGINPRGFYLGIATPSSPGGDAYGQSPSIQGYSYVQSADPNRAVTFPPLIFHLRCNKGGKAAGGELNAGTNRLLLGVNASGTGHEVEVHGSQEWSYFVEDIGPDLPSISTSKPWVSGGSGGGTAPPKKTYTTRWYANGYRVYKGDGSDRTSSASPDMIQGYSPYSPSNGDNYTQMLFTGNSFYGQTGITVSTAMSGATLRYAYIYLYASHWHYGSGGTGIIRTSTNTSLTSSVPSSTSVQQSGWGAGQGKKINISSIFATNHRSVWLGKSGGTNPLYYGRFAGPNVSTTSQRPYLELVYEK